MSYSYESNILSNSVTFEGKKLGRSYLKLKDKALKARAEQAAELVAEAKAARAAFIAIVPYLPSEFDMDAVVSDYCGLGKEWNANGRMVKEFADANGVDQQLAADLVSRQMTVAQDYAQATRGLKFGRYLSWLDDAANDADESLGIPENMEEIILSAYNRAAQWNQPADGLLIQDFAHSMGLSDTLPSWADALRKNMPSAEQAMEARKRISNRAAAQASQEQEAEQEMSQQYGNF